MIDADDADDAADADDTDDADFSSYCVSMDVFRPCSFYGVWPQRPLKSAKGCLFIQKFAFSSLYHLFKIWFLQANWNIKRSSEGPSFLYDLDIFWFQ